MIDEAKFLSLAARGLARGKAALNGTISHVSVSRRAFVTGTLSASGTLAFPTRLPENLKVLRDGQRILVEFDGARWIIDPLLFGRAARASLSRKPDRHFLRLRHARLPGTTLNFQLTAKIYLANDRWRLSLQVPELRIDDDLPLGEWIGGRAPVQGTATTFALRTAGSLTLDLALTTHFSLDADWRICATAADGHKLVADGIDLQLGRLLLQPKFKRGPDSIAGITDQGAAPVTRVEAELMTEALLEIGSSVYSSAVAARWASATRLVFECWGRASDLTAALLFDGEGALRIGAASDASSHLELPLDRSAMVIDCAQGRDTLLAAFLRRAAFSIDAGDVVLTLAARDDQPQLLRFRGGRAGPLRLNAEMLGAHVPVLNADRGHVDFSALAIEITDRPNEAESPSAISQSATHARVVLASTAPPPPACPEPLDDMRGLLVVGKQERMFLAPLDKGRLRVHRSLDLFHLEFGFCNYRVKVIQGRAWLEPYLAPTPCDPETQHHRLIVHFPAQNLAEQAFPLQNVCAPGTAGDQCVPTKPPDPPKPQMAEARRSGPTRLVFEINPGSADAKPKSLSIETLTEWSEMALAVNKRAMAPDMSVEDQLQAIGIKTNTDRGNALLKIMQYVTPPAPDETAVESVFRLQMSPSAGARFTTPRRPPQRSAGGKWKADALLWHARIDPTSGGDTLRVLWSRDDDLGWTFAINKVASFTASSVGTGYTMTVTDVTGYILPGVAVSSGSSGFPSYVQIQAQLSGTPGGAGTYQLSSNGSGPYTFTNASVTQGPSRWTGQQRPWDSDASEFYLSLTEQQRMQLVLLTSIPGLPALRRLTKTLGGPPTDDPNGRVRLPQSKFDYLFYDPLYGEGVFSPQPFSATLLLTALGSNLDSQFEIEPPATSSKVPFGPNPPWLTPTVELWQHKTRLGREMYVRILEKGFALPLGHRTAYVSLTERKFAWRNDQYGNQTKEVAAFLFQRHFTISRPIKTFPTYGQPFAGLDFPAKKNVTLKTTTSPDLAPPGNGNVPGIPPGNAFWLRTQPGDERYGCVIFEWTIDDDPTPIRAPMMFVNNTVAHDPDSMRKVIEYYRSLTDEKGMGLRTADHGGAARRYADFNKEGDTTYETANWLLSARGRLLPDSGGVLQEDFSMDGFMEGDDQPPFYPVTQNAQIKVQTLDRLVGKPQGLIKVAFNQTYVQNGFDGSSNPSEIYLDVISPEINLNVASDGTSSGGVAKPNTRVAAISRANGLIGGRVLANGGPGARVAALASPPPGASTEPATADFTAALSGRFDPIEYFGGAVAEAKLLGIVPLKDVIRVVAMAAAPKLAETVSHGAGDAADKIIQQTSTAITLIHDEVVPAIAKIEDSATQNFRDAGLGDDWRVLYPDLGARLSDLVAELERAVTVAEAANGVTGVDQIIVEASKIVQAVQRLTAEVERIARNPVPPLIGDYLATLQEWAQKLRDLAKNGLDGVVNVLGAQIDSTVQQLCQIAGTTEEAWLLFGDNGPAACAALLSDPQGALPYLQESLLYEVFGNYLWQFLDAVKRVEGAATDFIADVTAMKARIVATVLREADAAVNEAIDLTTAAAAEAAVKAMSAYTMVDSAARAAIKQKAVEAAKWIKAPGLEATIGSAVDNALPAPGQNKTVDQVAAAIRSTLPPSLADATKTWRAQFADKIKTAAIQQLKNSDLGQAIASIPAAVATVVAIELAGAEDRVKTVFSAAVARALEGARGAGRAAIVAEAVNVVDAIASSLSLPQARRDAFKTAVIARIDQALGGGIEAGLGPPSPVAAGLTALAAQIKKAVDQELSAFSADTRSKALAALTGALEARLKTVIAEAKADLTSQLTALVGSALDALLSTRQLKDFYDIRDKIVVTGETWCGTIAGEVKQVAGFINDVADQAIADTTTVQSYAKTIRQAVRSFTIPAGVSGVDAQRPALDRLRAAVQQTLDRLDALLAELATGRAQLQQELNKAPTLDCSKLGPALELSGRIFDLRRRAILEVRNLAQHLVDIDALVANLINAASVVGGSSPPGSLKIELTEAISDIGDALRGLIRAVTSIGTIEATPAPGSIWDRVKKKIDAIRNDSHVAAMQHYVDELGVAAQQLHDIGLALKASAETNGLTPAKILDLARQASGFSVDQERRLAALVLQIVVADDQLAGAIATGIDSVLMAIGTVLFPIHDVADTAVKAVIDIITLPNPPDPTKPSYILSVLIRDDVRQKIAKGEVELSYDLGQIKVLRDGNQAARIAAAQALRSKLSHRPLGLVLATGPLLQVVEAVFKGHISDIFNFSALQPLLRQAIEKLLPTRIDLAYDFNTDIGSFPPGDPILEMESSTDQDLVLKSRVTIDLFDPVGGRKVSVDGALRPFNVKLLGSAPDLATIKFKRATFSAGTGKAFSFEAPIDNVEIGSALAFIQALASWLSPGKGNGPYFFVSPDPPGVVAGFRFDAGLITLGEMQFLNIAFDVSGLLPFDDRAAEFRFGLASPDCPFLIVFVPYGGGGYVGLVATAKGIQQIAASFEFGAVVAVNFAVLQGQGRVSTGIYIEQDVGAGGVIAGFVHAAGEGHIACFGVSINIEVRIEQHTGSPSECIGSASYRFKFSLGLCDVSYSFTATYAVQGSGAGSTRAERTATRYVALRANRASEPSYQRPVDFCSNVPEKSQHWRQYKRRIALDALRA